MEKIEVMESYHKIIKDSMDINPRWFSDFSEKDKEHIIKVAASVIMTRDNFLIGGDFAIAVVNNNLMVAVDRADDVVIKALRFIVYCRKNLFIEHLKYTKYESN